MLKQYLKKFTDFVYYQLKEFQKVGKKMVRAKNQAELFASRIISLILTLILASMLYIVFTQPFIPPRLIFRAVHISVPMVHFIREFYKGVSISWMIAGICRLWLVPFVLFYMYVVLGTIVYAIWGGNYYPMGIHGGIMMILIGSLLPIAIRKEVLFRREQYRLEHDPDGKPGSSKKPRCFFLNLATLAYLPFFFGGFVMIGWVTGINDAVLNWWFNLI